MLRAGLPLAIVLAWAAPAWAQQDPEVEHVDLIEETTTTAPSDVQDDVTPKPRWDTLVLGHLSAGAGAIGGGDTINPGTGAMSLVDGGLTSMLTRGKLELSAPVTYSYRQTYSTALTDMHGRGGGKLLYRFNRRVKASVELGLGATWKPNWVDPFQPNEDMTAYLTTDRYSHWDRRAAADVDIRPARYQRVHVAYDYTLSVYKHDPNFDAIYQPLHLTPWDRDVHKLDVEWRMTHPGKNSRSSTFRVGVEGARWQYFYQFAGDAKTGITHSTSGGEPPNPLLELRSLKPRIESDFSINDAISLRARYELELMQDTYQGYLSYAGHHPQLMMTWHLPRLAELDASVEAYLRAYGRNSYDYQNADDPMHPPFAYGDRRQERLAYGTVDFRMPLPLDWSTHWAGIAQAKIAARKTNYVYGIDWNYFNWMAWTGAEYRY
jgi:hypothetical protein